ncbi:MAG: trigger factor [Bacilli bacterium]|nr:trigger factor [Bacilli bacterium]MDD4623952.1 trigger factor [Bacilli bacterium]
MKNVHEIAVKIEGKKWEDLLTKSFEKNVKGKKVDGFREGKIPRDIYIKKYGIESLYMDAVNDAIPNAYEEVEKSGLKPIVQPKVDIKKIDEKGLELTFTVTESPEINIKKYKGLKVKKDKVSVSKEEVKEEIENLRKQYAEIVIKEGTIELGDTVVIDFEGFKDDKPFEGGKGENFPLEIGSKTFIPGFEEQLVGLKTDDKKDIKVTFPEDYPAENLKGKEVVFKVNIHEVKNKQIPELNEDFILDLAMENVKTEEDLNKKVKENLTEKKEMDADNKLVDSILDEINKNVTVDIPEELINQEIDRMIANYEERLKMQGITLQQYLEFTKMNEEDLRKQLGKEAEKSVKYRLVIEEIIKLEDIKVTDKEVDKELEEMSKIYQMSTEEVEKAMGGKDYLQHDLLVKKVIDFLKENNKE